MLLNSKINVIAEIVKLILAILIVQDTILQI